jgi:hypothetical protein
MVTNQDGTTSAAPRAGRPRVPVLPAAQVELVTARLLAGVRVAAWRMGLAGYGDAIPLPILRGAFGAALHDLSMAAYERVFRPEEAEGAPAYLLRHSPHRLAGSALFELVLFEPAFEHVDVVLAAMQLAGERGLGRERRAFAIRRLAWLDPWGRPGRDREGERPFELDLSAWPLAGDPAQEPCRLLFPDPIRILRQKVLIEQPTLRDVVVAGCRRLAGFLPPTELVALRVLQESCLAVADTLAVQPFVGVADGVGRWSASQQRFIELRGVTGHLDLPDGPGPLWRLLAALQWLHCGKATVVGLGRVVITPIW